MIIWKVSVNEVNNNVNQKVSRGFNPKIGYSLMIPATKFASNPEDF